MDELLAAITELDQMMRKQFGYERTDGAVVKLNSFPLRERNWLYLPKLRVGPWHTSMPPNRRKRSSTPLPVQVGRTGALTPVAELEPVFLAGSTIARATLHNEDEIKRKDIRVGDTVIIEKAGEVIPAVIGVVLEKRPPEATAFDFYQHLHGKCPVCGGTISRDPEFVVWRCENITCPAQATRQLEFFCARGALDIESVGGIVADKLVERGFVKEPLDLFELKAEPLGEFDLGTTDAPRVFGRKNARRSGNRTSEKSSRSRAGSLRWPFLKWVRRAHPISPSSTMISRK